ncbi:indolepyruvate ferredoxin oxidoreductase subunit alpha [Hyperthermus butylicus]|uniref:Indolepyruvate oxidoreductase subunit IorA n=1 Tax=Hyperthermus butylicus (strain DSM 5456 / JCM 9403 / PLM1-5) TaxID=415426 RepID=A2BN79_HYPBU|nr:indolepyruvate ferredoxin oxidoreductase subunit alpha [Hyperthermus butylicus]ABM81440.1 indolepyruvate oxidoreductase subunit iorA [Hyperthermus butylicus DSM 5456]
MAYEEVLAPAGSKVLMLGNAAIARGFLEAGVQFAAAYPGTPSTEIVEALSAAARMLGGKPYVEWSVNEKVALEAALGAAISGARAITAMKHVGLNVAADPFFSSAYIGVRGAFVVVSADDPWMHSSQNEQDNRWYGLHAYIPVVEPTGPQDAKEAAKLALKYSEKYRRPFLLRTTTRIAHTRIPVETDEIPVNELEPQGVFEKNPAKWTLVPQHARRMRIELLDFWDRVRRELADFPLNSVEYGGAIAVVGAGLGYRYAREAVKLLGLESEVTLFKLATTVPLPEPIADKILEHETIIVVEEGDPVVEIQLKTTAQERGAKARILGKHGKDTLLRRYGELTLDMVADALAKVTDREPPAWAVEKPEPPRTKIPPRPPVLCPGCPHRSLFYALRRAVNKLRIKPVYSGDIGCYSLGVLPPFEMQDTIICMGASIGAANGMVHVLKDPNSVLIAIIGDSTFYHAGIPPLINAVYNNAPMLVVVLDNRTTAMTGHQPHPGVGISALGTPATEIPIEEVARGVGVEKILVADAFNIRDAEQKLVEALKYVIEKRKPAVVVSRGACILLALSVARRAKVKPPVYYVDEEKCTACGICYTAFNCPAIRRRPDGKAMVDPALCTGCGVCAQVCPFGAFKPSQPPSEEWLKIMRTAKPA